MTRPALLRPPRAALGALALSLLCAAGAAAQTAPPSPAPAADSAATRVVFAGRVFDRATSRPIAGARVELPNDGQRVVTDSTGAFRMDRITDGEHELVIAAAGYQPLAVRVGLRPEMPSVDVPLSPAAAEGAASAEFMGLVVDAKSNEPIARARVEFVGEGTPTQTAGDGTFRFPTEPGAHMLRVRAPGYPTLAALIAVEPGMAPATIKLEQDVVMLQGLQVMADRMERRRLSAGISSELVSEKRLQESTSRDMKSFLREEYGLNESVCGALGGGGGSGCVVVRGSPVTPTIMIDDVPQFGGITALEMYDPDDFARVEMYGGGRTMFLYTIAYMERQARSKNPPIPIPVR